jgi:pimeloyl-ACP methyl ester carboxylesterase
VPVTLTYRMIPKRVGIVTRSGVPMVRMRATSGWDPALPAVVLLHGWPDTQPADPVLDDNLSPIDPPPFRFGAAKQAVDQLLATGRTVYAPYTGASWGTTTSSPNLGGVGTDAIAAAVAQAAADGCTAPPDLWGNSMGACNALNYAWRNPTTIGRLFLMAPAVDLASVYDWAAPVATSMRGVVGGTDKATWYPLAAPFDPARNLGPLAALAGRIQVFSAEDDAIVLWPILRAWCDSLDVPLIASAPPGYPGGGHFFAPLFPGWTDSLPLAWFEGVTP